MRRGAAPERGEVVWLSFSPQAGREQAGRRPALVLTPAPFNRRIGLAFVCPVTSRVKGYPFEVALRGVDGGIWRGPRRSVAQSRLAHQACRARRQGAGSVVSEVVAKLRPLLGA